LEDGSIYSAQSFGYEGPTAGEVVFNTGMVGYVESLTDPSYKSQILVSTYPLVGNYGVPDVSGVDALGLPEGFESDRIHTAGVIVSDYSHEWSHSASKQSLSDWLKSNKVPGLYGLDTRALTKKLRTSGSMLGKIVFDKDVAFEDPNSRNLVAEVSIKEPRTFGSSDTKILAIDCGIKYQIVRSLVQRGVEVKLVPWDYDPTPELLSGNYHGLFLSNGPGDPAMCSKTIDNLRVALDAVDCPIFGICLGNQLLALAAGCKTYKLPWGNRGQNIPVKDMITNKHYITPQNHGFGVDNYTMPSEWKPLFVNINDLSNEGIVHSSKPFFSAQFHPEARSGPTDTAFLFDTFIQKAQEFQSMGRTLGLFTPETKMRNKKVLVIGSGGLSIGQAGEFDYSGSQCIKALTEENVESILINPNIATVQTRKELADKVYFLPCTAHFVEEVIKRERPDGLLLGFGGQTALNLGVELHDKGILAKYGVEVLGTQVQSIMWAEDRDLFKQKLAEIGEPVARSFACSSTEEALKAAQEIGYPLMARVAYALGGLGSGFCHNDTELTELCKQAFATSPQVLIEQSIKGWKEVEYEVVRDQTDNCITVCNMENFDPMGIHTGESIVVAPSQTLTNDEYHMLRQASIRVVRHLGVIGECNVQYALDPHSDNYAIIEMNPRLSRSSALASKATGYPLAFVATKLALGLPLASIKNGVTQVTSACFEPSLDYIVCKVPRWDVNKFSRVKRQLGSSMKSVGEVMAIGRSFNEVLQKALRMVDPSYQGFEQTFAKYSQEAMLEELANPTDRRIFALAQAFDQGMSVDELHDITKIDRWFLHKLFHLTNLKNRLCDMKLDDISRDVMLAAKRNGFSDKQIARYIGSTELAVRAARKELEVVPCVKQIDTLGGEWEAQTNYLYLTYNGEENDIKFDQGEGTLVVGSGTYRIGSSVEFDYATVITARTLMDNGQRTYMLNYNPETVSTDYDESDKLYFEEISLERVMDIHELEGNCDVVMSMGGQLPQNLALPAQELGVNIKGTNATDVDRAEDRQKFSALMDSIGVQQPEWSELVDNAQAKQFCDRVGYPVLVRPSYVLSGAAMNVVWNESELEGYLNEAVEISSEFPVVITKFMEGAVEIDVDAVAQAGEMKCYAISEHVEKGGVHSGDATLVLPSVNISAEDKARVKEATIKVAKALNINGCYNAQFLLCPEDNSLRIIETNLRASRSLPFVSKTLNIDFVEIAAKIMLGHDVPYQTKCDEDDRLGYVGVKAPQFSYKRLGGSDPLLGVEMASTGEVATFGKNVHEAYIKSLLASLWPIPPPKSNCYMTMGERNVEKCVSAAKNMLGAGFTLAADSKTAKVLAANGIEAESYNYANAIERIRGGDVNIVLELGNGKDEDTYSLRRTAVDFVVPLVVDAQQADLLGASLQAIDYQNKGLTQLGCESYSEVIGEDKDRMSKMKIVQRRMTEIESQAEEMRDLSSLRA
jgi:carbamoyl-phosphate synthase large subunit/carbamoyl-phosphate synthase small subunit